MKNYSEAEVRRQALKVFYVLEALVAFAKTRGIPVRFESPGDDLLGATHSCPHHDVILIEPRLTIPERAVVLAHELAHVILHSSRKGKKKLAKGQEEREAQTVAAGISLQFGLAFHMFSYRRYDRYPCRWKRAEEAVWELIDFCEARI